VASLREPEREFYVSITIKFSADNSLKKAKKEEATGNGRA
jgi:hypothetical protein